MLVVCESVVVCQQCPTDRAVTLTVFAVRERVATTVETVGVFDNGISEGYRVTCLQQLDSVREVVSNVLGGTVDLVCLMQA